MMLERNARTNSRSTNDVVEVHDKEGKEKQPHLSTAGGRRGTDIGFLKIPTSKTISGKNLNGAILLHNHLLVKGS
jgi:hypothetical protein